MDDEAPCYEITVMAFGLSPEAIDAMFERVAEAAHALDEEVFCVGGHERSSDKVTIEENA